MTKRNKAQRELSEALREYVSTGTPELAIGFLEGRVGWVFPVNEIETLTRHLRESAEYRKNSMVQKPLI